MRSLLIRFFLSFWSIILITIVAGGALGYFYAERARTAIQNFEVSEAMLQASASLRDGGREGLTEWLRSLPGSTASLVYIIDDRGDDLLDRTIPPPVLLAMRRFGTRDALRRPHPRDFANLRPARPFTQLVGPDEQVYTLFVLPPQGALGRWIARRGGAGIAILALLISATVSYLLARTISRPVRRLRESADAIAGGSLDTRVSDRIGKRRDEIGLLARDFDRMANELERAWSRQTELTRNVSHELRSPLARLRVALELARRKTGEIAELDKIEAETERLDELIGQILAFSRLDSDSLEDRSLVELDELLRSVVEDVRYEYGHTGIELLSKGGTIVNAYPSALRSGIENIVRNAAQHSKDGGTIRVHIDAGPRNAVVTIEDEGGGVAEDELDDIFEPFYRSQAGQGGERGQGSGLGLAIASRAIALNNGTLSARNGERGLCVEIRLPIER